MINLPKTRELSDAERFCIGLKELAIECRLNNIFYNSFGVTKYVFDDGSSVGGIRAYREAGLINIINIKQ